MQSLCTFIFESRLSAPDLGFTNTLELNMMSNSTRFNHAHIFPCPPLPNPLGKARGISTKFLWNTRFAAPSKANATHIQLTCCKFVVLETTQGSEKGWGQVAAKYQRKSTPCCSANREPMRCERHKTSLKLTRFRPLFHLYFLQDSP